VHRGFRDDIGVETVAEIDRINVVTFQVAIHDREENLQKQVDGIDQYRQQVQPCLAGHHDRRSESRVHAISFPIFLSFYLSLRSCAAESDCRAVVDRSSEQAKDFPEAGCSTEGVTRPLLRNGLEAAKIEFECYEEMGK